MESRAHIFISPVARRLAEESQLDYRHVQGTGPNGRIIRMDVEAALAQRQAVAATVAAPPVTAPAAPVPELAPAPAAVDTGEVGEIPLTSMRRSIAKRLDQSMQTAPHFYMTGVIGQCRVADLRRQINDYAERAPDPVQVGINDLVI